MSIFFRARRDMDTYADLIPSRLPASAAPVTRDNSLTSSVKWACQRLRADLVSTTPLDVSKQTVNGVATTMPTPPVLSMPDGRMDVTEWLYGSSSIWTTSVTRSR